MTQLPAEQYKNEWHTAKYVRRSAIVNAIRLTKENFSEVMQWSGGTHYSTPPMRQITGLKFPPTIYQNFALFGDWVVQSADRSFHGVPEVYWNEYVPFPDASTLAKPKEGVMTAEEFMKQRGNNLSVYSYEEVCDWLTKYAAQFAPQWREIGELKGEAGADYWATYQDINLSDYGFSPPEEREVFEENSPEAERENDQPDVVVDQPVMETIPPVPEIKDSDPTIPAENWRKKPRHRTPEQTAAWVAKIKAAKAAKKANGIVDKTASQSKALTQEQKDYVKSVLPAKLQKDVTGEEPKPFVREKGNYSNHRPYEFNNERPF